MTDERKEILERLPGGTEVETYGASLLELWGAPGRGFRWRWNFRMRSRAGAAWLHEDRIDLNPRLLAQNPDSWKAILAHELAHLLVHDRHGEEARPHGPEWRDLMRRAGHPPAATHSFDTRGLRRQRPRRKNRAWLFLHCCLHCTASWISGRLRRDRVCPNCGPGEIRVFRGPRNPSGRRDLESLARDHARGLDPESLRA